MLGNRDGAARLFVSVAEFTWESYPVTSPSGTLVANNVVATCWCGWSVDYAGATVAGRNFDQMLTEHRLDHLEGKIEPKKELFLPSA